MNDKEFNKYLGIANHDIQVANNHEELKSYVASILFELDKLQSNWNSLREFVKENGFYERQDIIDAICNPNEDKLIYIDDVLNKMNELEGDDK